GLRNLVDRLDVVFGEFGGVVAAGANVLVGRSARRAGHGISSGIIPTSSRVARACQTGREVTFKRGVGANFGTRVFRPFANRLATGRCTGGSIGRPCGSHDGLASGPRSLSVADR